jgi:hypothetical protein
MPAAASTITKAPAPTLLKVGTRALSTHGYRRDVLEEHLKEHLGKPASKQWCEVSCAARTIWGRDTKKNREEIRKRLPMFFRSMLDRGLFVAIDYAPLGHGHHGEAQAIKIYQQSGEVEKQHAKEQLGRMHRRRQITDAAMKKAAAILQLPLPFESENVGAS